MNNYKHCSRQPWQVVTNFVHFYTSFKRLIFISNEYNIAAHSAFIGIFLITNEAEQGFIAFVSSMSFLFSKLLHAIVFSPIFSIDFEIFLIKVESSLYNWRGGILNHKHCSFIVVELLKYCISYWVSCGSLCFLRGVVHFISIVKFMYRVDFCMCMLGFVHGVYNYLWCMQSLW